MKNDQILLFAAVAIIGFLIFTRPQTSQASIQSAPLSDASTNLPFYAIYNAQPAFDYDFMETLNSTAVAPGQKSCAVCSLFGAGLGSSY